MRRQQLIVGAVLTGCVSTSTYRRSRFLGGRMLQESLCAVALFASGSRGESGRSVELL